MPKSVPVKIHPEKADWQQQLADVITDPAELLDILALPRIPVQAPAPDTSGNGNGFPLRVTRHYLNKIQPGNPLDPLLLQVLVQPQEYLHSPGFNTDPVGDLEAVKAPGLLHKYHGRALLITTAACAIHCRYCFRRHFPYNEHRHRASEWNSRIDYLRRHPEINEVILSGGDPLMLSDQKLDALFSQLESIPQLRYCRIHSRLPTLVTGRITDRLLQRMAQSRLQFVLVTHINHAREIDQQDSLMFTRLHQAGISLLNQSVLLHQINDDVESLAQLSHALFQNRVLPYYLHMLDPVAGAAHFDVDEARAHHIMAKLRAQLPGYLLPRLVREIAGEHSKSPVIGL